MKYRQNNIQELINDLKKFHIDKINQLLEQYTRQYQYQEQNDTINQNSHQFNTITGQININNHIKSVSTEKSLNNYLDREEIDIPGSPKQNDPEFSTTETKTEPKREQSKFELLNKINIQKKKKIEESIIEQKKRQVKCMSFNLLNGQRHTDPSYNWENREKAVIQVIRTHDPDILGTQEAYHWQLDYIRWNLPQYKQYGSSRNGYYNEKADEFCAVLYKKDKFRVVQGETFFLSETPDIVSKSWGSVFNRIATAVKFEILASGKQFWFFSTQLDFSSDEAVRCNQTQVLLERMQKLNAEGLPVVLSGDFHSPSFGPAHQKLTQEGHLRDAASKAREVGKMTESSVRGSDMQARKNRLNEGLFGKKTHQDWIFTDKDTEVLTFAVCTDKYDGVYPALHYPIVSDLEFK
ncbi:endonuclease/exonuclease/phosphatase_family protein [Hexamita inflata]|uniref:Endonuclease/exonuclease/phosphatase family protein n=1 Tax=Hexamita inflata TaxID=28002 RepID=A0AA86PGD4_9EUKA|nr:endonuclease/exonuclease/phosphatase family protein [Hexamita inflata]